MADQRVLISRRLHFRLTRPLRLLRADPVVIYFPRIRILITELREGFARAGGREIRESRAWKRLV